MIGNGIVLLITYLFFEKLIMYIVLFPIAIIYMKRINKRLILKRKNKLRVEFCEFLEATEMLLKAGNSIEVAFGKVQNELMHIHGENSDMLKEIRYINHCIKLDVSTEKIILDFARRADVAEINNFAEVFIISKRSDGNLIKVMQTVCNSIRDNINMDRQIKMSISGILQEINIMQIMPIGILVYLKVFSRGYFDCVHSNLTGQCIMGIILVVYIIACTAIDHMQRKVFCE